MHLALEMSRIGLPSDQPSTCRWRSTQLVLSTSSSLFTVIQSDDTPSRSEALCSLYLWKGGCPADSGCCQVISTVLHDICTAMMTHREIEAC